MRACTLHLMHDKFHEPISVVSQYTPAHGSEAGINDVSTVPRCHFHSGRFIKPKYTRSTSSQLCFNNLIETLCSLSCYQFFRIYQMNKDWLFQSKEQCLVDKVGFMSGWKLCLHTVQSGGIKVTKVGIVFGLWKQVRIFHQVKGLTYTYTWAVFGHFKLFNHNFSDFSKSKQIRNQT